MNGTTAVKFRVFINTPLDSVVVAFAIFLASGKQTV